MSESEKCGQPPKRKFEFEPWDALCDVYVDGKKVFEAHSARNGHIYLHLPPDFEDERVEFRSFDPRNSIEAELIYGEVMDTEAGLRAKEEAEAEADRQAKLKREAEKRALAERVKREAEAKRLAKQRLADAEAKKRKASLEAEAAKKAAEG